jgi:hypothetical protein
MASVIPRKKVLIPRHSEVYGRVNYKARNGRKWHEKFLRSFTKNPASASRIDSMFLSQACFGTEFREFASIFVPWHRILASSAEWFGTEFQEFSVPRNSPNLAGTNQLFRLFHLPFYLSEIANPTCQDRKGLVEAERR